MSVVINITDIYNPALSYYINGYDYQKMSDGSIIFFQMLNGSYELLVKLNRTNNKIGVISYDGKY